MTVFNSSIVSQQPHAWRSKVAISWWKHSPGEMIGDLELMLTDSSKRDWHDDLWIVASQTLKETL